MPFAHGGIVRQNALLLFFIQLSLSLVDKSAGYLLILVYARMLSRNLYKRSEENNRYMRMRMSVGGKFEMIKVRWTQRKDYKFFTCPACRTTLRVPRHKGKINIVCKKCGNSFTGRT